MNTMIAVAVALIGGLVQSHRHRDRRAADVHMACWLLWVVGISTVVATGFHVFDPVHTAESIGYTRGDGGFQWENAMGDLAIGLVGVLAYWVRGSFWLATIIVLTVQYWGDAAGHLYFWMVHNNTAPNNIGIPLWTDILLPVVMWTLFVWSWRVHGDAFVDIASHARRAAASSRPADVAEPAEGHCMG